MNYKKELLNRINHLLEGKWDVPKFKNEYYFFYIREVPDDALSVDEDLVFGDIQTKLDYAVEDPAEDRQYGYITYQEYVDWVREKMKSLPK